ncbi:MAG: class I tRNA ligase family protein, partial [Bacteroidota bacterium]
MTAKAKADVLMNYRLVYRKEAMVNWCEELGTVLANDEVKDGVSERGGYPVEKRPIIQWSLRTTAYAERLLSGLDTVDWPDALKIQQTNWIGRSEGASLFFDLVDHDGQIEVFTTRPDTIFGATFMVLAPEHDLVKQITTPEQQEKIDVYLKYVNARSEVDRMSDVKRVTGEFTGAYATNPFTGQQIPIWIAEYVLAGYGTGAIMAVPSDDERDHKFATHFEIPIIEVVDKSDYPGATLHDKLGKMINSDFLNGMEVPAAIERMLSEIESREIGERKINYKLRDANYSRQRYWGEPIPIKYDSEGVDSGLSLDQLPLELPEMANFEPGNTIEAPLARNRDYINQFDGYTLEADTMPGFAGSSWYFLRYMDPENEATFASPEAIDYWKQVDLYIGGAEHAVGHLMYSRTWHKFLYDLGMVPTDEPYAKLVNQGMLQGIIEFIYLVKAKKDGKSTFISADLVDQYGGEEAVARIPVDIRFVEDYGNPESFLNEVGIAKFKDWRPDYKDAEFVFGGDKGKFFTKSEVGKISKRYYNAINPDEVVEQYGSDCFRMYEMFLGPIEQSKPWDTQGIEGVSKFLRRFWALFFDGDQFTVTNEEPTKEEYKSLHTAIKKLNTDIAKLALNTGVSALMVCLNDLRKAKCNKRAILDPLVRLIAPYAPHLAEELWSMLGHETSVTIATYPEAEEKYLKEDSISYPISVNGKKRLLADFPADASKEEIEKAALELEGLAKWIEGKQIRKVIVVPKRMVNVVVS